MTSLHGLFVPMITPFTADGALAPAALEAHAHRVLDAGATGLVALGTTAEPSALTAGERAEVLDRCAAVCAERDVPLIVCAGGNATAESVRAVGALRHPVAAVLAVVPYYVRPSEEGVVAHFTALAAAAPAPLLVYDVPYRTARPLSGDTLVRLAGIPNIAGFKHSVGGVDAASVELMARAGSTTTVLCGDDRFASALLALGARGGILAAANVAPAEYAGLIAAWLADDAARGRALGHRLDALGAALFAEPNPTVVKAVLAEQGLIPSAAVRLPLLPAAPESTALALRAAASAAVAPV
ncbi:4-hydroxy-tetrahydrodipicolinate synthase [Nocardia neocaledoniensis NBRC 108232]|uniref:4-hydroxy-tetrahydrodipicolinate synthase n=1 Tax=Nocardia neocaledoniensis TaxID=236511 RepID=A0A317NKC5_9NOCA|nr:4-hydroxy-tetrahydrodipicolinate synthase [Nocardia neocaledoniensis]PWV75223.1 4-hydroxy-tetrahydrodipicolinate synthase [Nocardia neocaledoniensis]GEM33806.1 4-hydroxy-tetrahydrodipicolinate synthase [Nocardia neocaledoniensis NBRC 108232]